MSSGAFLIRFLLGLAGTIAALSLPLAFAFSSAGPEAHAPGAGAEGHAFAFSALVGPSAGSRIEPRFSTVAGALVGKRVAVRCWSSADWHRLMRRESAYTGGKLNAATLGFAPIGGTRINLAPTVCNGLVDLADTRARPTDDAGRLRLASALVTLAHEPQHSRGVTNEAVAECAAIQLAPTAAAQLGFDRAYATSLLRTYWRHYADELPNYRSFECRKGGALDLRRPDSIWPRSPLA